LNNDYINSRFETLSGVKESVNYFSLFSELTKLKITIFVAFTTALGYILAAESLSLAFIYPVAGIFILACGSAAVNHFQERRTDALMARTMGRPVPSGRLSARSALITGLLLLIAGSVILYFGSNTTTLIIGLLTFYWYNAIYTPLKKKSALAIIPGSVVGALPPVAGWAAAGGDITDIKIVYVAFYFFLWQIPHFWLLILKYGDDYKRAGFPVLTDSVKREKLTGWIFYLTAATALIGAFTYAVGIINFIPTAVMLALASLWLAYTSFRSYKAGMPAKQIMRSFIAINLYTLLFITFLSIDKLIKLI
jgi:protoheme IX farnesyltransferase